MLYQKVLDGPPFDGPALFVKSDKPAVDTRVTSQIAEVVAVKGSIADADLHSLECHLLAKYGIPPSSR
jgi:hypothetical protein